MQRKNLSPYLFLSFVLLATMACSLGASAASTPAALPVAPAPAGMPSEPSVEPDGATVTSGCDNPYFPAVLNASWTYKSTGTSKGEFLFTDVVKEVREDGFTISSDFGYATKVNDWSCTPEGLRVYETGEDDSAGITVESGQFQFEAAIRNASGVTLPAALTPGARWTQSYEYETSGELGGTPVTSLGQVTSNNEYLGDESITTPAGTFQAARIRVETTEQVQATFGGSTVTSSSQSVTIYWFVQGVGRVRSEASGSNTETTELQSYAIP